MLRLFANETKLLRGILSQVNRVIFVFLMAITAGWMSACSVQDDTPMPFKIAMAQQPDNALNFIAFEKGYFEQQGLAVTVEMFPSGKRALEEGFLKRDFDMVSMSEVPFVFALEKHPDLRIFGHMYGADNVNRIVARRGIGLNNIEDLQGKVIGTQKSSAVHYFFHRIYNAFNIPRESFTLKFYKAEELPQALVRGEIDAFSMREPYVSEAERLLNGDVNIFSMPGIYQQYGVMVARGEALKHNKEAYKRYLNALHQAREYAISHSEESIALVARHLNTPVKAARQFWRSSHLQLGLHQGLVNTIENEIIWRNFLTDLGLDSYKVDLTKFDISDYIDFVPMVEVYPHAVMVVYERAKSE